MRILISGFEPAFGIKRTPSGEIAELYGRTPHSRHEFHGCVLPQLFRKSFDVLMNHVTTVEPELLVMVGAHSGSSIRLEKMAINYEHDSSGDNSKIPVFDRHINTSGNPAYETNLNLRKIKMELDDLGVRTIMSYHAGTHVCNSLYYQVLEHICSEASPLKCLFIHVPFTPDFGVPISDSNYGSFRQLVRNFGLVTDVVAAVAGNSRG